MGLYYNRNKETCLEHLNMLNPSLYTMFMNCLDEPEKRKFVLDIIYQANYIINDDNDKLDENRTSYYNHEHYFDYFMNSI